MSQDPSDRAPRPDPTAAPDHDRPYEPPPSWPPSEPPAPAADLPTADPTEVIDPSAARSVDGSGPPQPAPEHAPWYGRPSGAPAQADPAYGTPAAGTGGYAPPGYVPPGPIPPGYDPSGYGASGSIPPGSIPPGYDPSGYGASGYGASGQPQAGPGGGYGGYGGGRPGYGSGHPAGGYGGGYPGYPPQPYVGSPPTNTMAILSLVLAFVLPPLGVVFGFVARGQTKQTGEGGDGLALAGIIVGAVFTLFIVVPIVLAILFAVSVGVGG